MRDKKGEESISNEGYIMKIIEFIDFNKIQIEFQDKHKHRMFVKYSNFKRGCIKNPYHPSVFKVGYVGVGKYKRIINDDIYNKWFSMIRRCYDPYTVNRDTTYINCYVCDEWLNFQNFAKWYEENYYECNGEEMHLDKDILVKGNKIYSPQTCIFVPKRINLLFTKRKQDRGEYPIGVSEWNNKKYDKKYLRVRCNCFDKIKNKYTIKSLGCFPLNKPFQAFTIYKQFKENYIKQVADEYKDLIPRKLYEALYKWEVEIND